MLFLYYFRNGRSKSISKRKQDKRRQTQIDILLNRHQFYSINKKIKKTLACNINTCEIKCNELFEWQQKKPQGLYFVN